MGVMVIVMYNKIKTFVYKYLNLKNMIATVLSTLIYVSALLLCFIIGNYVMFGEITIIKEQIILTSSYSILLFVMNLFEDV